MWPEGGLNAISLSGTHTSQLQRKGMFFHSLYAAGRAGNSGNSADHQPSLEEVTALLRLALLLLICFFHVIDKKPIFMPFLHSQCL